MTTKTRTPSNGKVAPGSLAAPGSTPTLIEMHPARAFKRDERVQRPLIPARVKHFANHLDLDGLGVITVSRRANGDLVVMDGQHRLAALMQLDMGDWPLTCHVYSDQTLAKEAALFRQLNDTRRPTAIEDFLKGLVAEDVEAIRIDAICRAHSLRVADQTGDGIIACVAALRTVFRAAERAMAGDAALDAALGVIVAAWGVRAEAVEGHLVSGIGQLFLTYGDEIDRPSLTTKLAKTKGGAAGLLGTARAAREYRKGSIGENVAEIVRSTYNTARRTRRLGEQHA